MNFRAFEWRQVIEKIKILPSTPVPSDDKDLVVKGLLRPSEKFWFSRCLVRLFFRLWRDKYDGRNAARPQLWLGTCTRLRRKCTSRKTCHHTRCIETIFRYGLLAIANRLSVPGANLDNIVLHDDGKGFRRQVQKNVSKIASRWKKNFQFRIGSGYIITRGNDVLTSQNRRATLPGFVR